MATNKKYLSKEGLTHLVELIKNGTAAKDHTHDFSDLSGGIAHELSGEVIEQKLVNGNGSVGELTVYGATRQNLWSNPSGTKNGVTVTANTNGSITLSGTPASTTSIRTDAIYVLRPDTTYTVSIDKNTPAGIIFSVLLKDADDTTLQQVTPGRSGESTSATFTVPTGGFAYAKFDVFFNDQAVGSTVSGTYRVMLNEGDTAQPWCPPGLNSVGEDGSVDIVTEGKNLLARMGPRLPYTYAGITFSDNGDGGIRVSGTTTASAYYNFFGSSAQQAPFITAGTYTASLIGGGSGLNLSVGYFNGEIGADYTGSWISTNIAGMPSTNSVDRPVYVRAFLSVVKSKTVDIVVYPQLELGSTATAYEPPNVTTTPIDLDGHALNSLPDGTRDELRIDGTGAVTLVQKVGVATAPTAAGSWTWSTDVAGGRARFTLNSVTTEFVNRENGMCDKLPMRLKTQMANAPSYAIAGGSYGFAKNPAITSTATAATVAGGATYLYPLAAPREVELPGVSMPSVNADSITVFAASNVPTELDATVIDLPVVPISSGGTGATTASGARTGLDVYSKAEVDAKVGDAIDLPLAVSKGGTGAVASLAANYNLLNSATQRASNTVIEDDTNAAFFTESPSTTAGALQKIPFLVVWNYIVAKIRSTFGFSSSNVLPVNHGGTGATTARVAEYNIMNQIRDVTTDITDNDYFVSMSTQASTTNGATYKRKATTVWSWIKTKADAVYAAKSHTHTSLSYKGNISASTDWDTLAAGIYTVSSSTPWTEEKHAPVGAYTYGTAYIVNNGANMSQIYIAHQAGQLYFRNRFDSSNAFAGWDRAYTTTKKPTPSEIGAAASSHDHSAANITSGTLPISRGGTGMTANPAMLVNLASASTANVFGSAPRPGVTGILPVSHGGTGATAKGTTLLSNIGITISSSEAPATGTPGTIHIQLLD